MKLRHLRIVVQTTGGPFEANIPFENGLVVIRATNTRGKSTCFKSILTALGLEAILTTSQSELPLTPAVMHRITWKGKNFDVTESDIYLEIENSTNDRVTIQRTVKGERDWHLVTLYKGPALTTPGEYSANDFYVSRPGGATREAGFHRELANFLGWNLPNVSTYEDKECPLYLQMIFPFVFVEQKRGWATISPPIPTQWRIREPHRRVIEFLLKLDAYKVAIRRQHLQAERNRIQSEWSALRERAKVIAGMVNGDIQALPLSPTIQWPPQVLPSIIVPDGAYWQSLRQVLIKRKNKRNQIINEKIPAVQEIAAFAEADLAHTEAIVREKEVLLSRLLNTLELENEEIEATKQRLATIKDDLIRNKDAKTLRDMGSKQIIDLNEGHCPICHQTIQDSLVPLEAKQSVMSLDENISFLDEQRKTFELVLVDSQRVAFARERQVVALRKEISDFRTQIRTLRRTLISDGRLPSEEAIRARIELERAIEQDTEVEDRFQKVLEEFSVKSKEWDAIEKELAKLPKSDVTEEDISKINKWTSLLKEQLQEYGFDSLPINEINISSDSYYPEHDGFDLQASISASDLIRTIWSYLMGMLELARTESTNHPGLLVFDEPRQQSADKISFGALMKRGATSIISGQQVIVFTSEEVTEVETSLKDVPHNLIDFGSERLLQPIKQ